MACDENRAPLTQSELAATCPFMRTLLVNNPTLYDSQALTMSRTQLNQFVKDQRPLGVHGNLERVLSFFASVNQTPFRTLFSNLLEAADTFSTNFQVSRGNHPGSSDVYRMGDGVFDPVAFGRLALNRPDGETMTPSDMARAIVQFNQANGGSTIDLFKSAGEFALLFLLLRQPEEAQIPAMQMRVEHMRTLFECNTWPPNALANLGTATARQWKEMTLLIAEEIVGLKGASVGGHFDMLVTVVHQIAD